MGDIFAIQSLKTCSELTIKRIFSISTNIKMWKVRFSRSWSEMQSSPPAESIETILIVKRPAQFWSATSVFRDRTFDLPKQRILYSERDDTGISCTWIQKRKQGTVVGSNDLWLKWGLGGLFLESQTAKFRFDDICMLCHRSRLNGLCSIAIVSLSTTKSSTTDPIFFGQTFAIDL